MASDPSPSTEWTGGCASPPFAEWSSADDPGSWADPPAAGRLGEIRVPTLVITGRRDVPQMTEIGDLIHAGIAGSRRAVIEDADHVVGWRTPDELARLVLDFLG